jgi:hypothetical protein
MLARVYIVVTDAAGSVVARRYLHRHEIPGWLGTKVGGGGARCEVYDDAPALGGRALATFLPHAGTWREQ